MALLLHLSEADEQRWADGFRAALPGLRVVLRGEDFDPGDIDYIFVWKPKAEAIDGLTRLKAVLSFGAGVDALLQHPGLPEAPIVRFIDKDLTQRMTDYVVANVGMHHRLITRFRRDQAERRWVQLYPEPASATTVGVMGLGQLGLEAVRHLRALGFRLRGWSRTRKHIDDVETFAGPAELGRFLAATDILVNLLPLTPETRGILNANIFGQLRRNGLQGEGPVLINAGRGGHQVEADIVAALADGTLKAASLDVFETEPLPGDSPLWGFDNVYFSPHVAAASSEGPGVAFFAEVIREHEAGRPLPNVVDRVRGY